MAMAAFVPIAPRMVKAPTAAPSISSFTPGTSRVKVGGATAGGGGGNGAAASPAAGRRRQPRMRVAVATPSKAAAAAAEAIRKAGGVDPVTHHVAETLRQVRAPPRSPPGVDAPTRWERPPTKTKARTPTTAAPLRPRVSPAEAAAAARAAVGSETAKAWAARQSVTAGTAVGGGRMGGDAVAIDAAAKRAAWAAELRALRSADAVAPVRAPTVAPQTALPVGGRRSSAYEARMARLSSHATTSAGAVAAKAPAAVVTHGTAAGGGWATPAAVAADAAAKRDAWASEMAALRARDTPAKAVAAPPRARQAIATNAPVYTPAPVSLPQSVTVVGAPRTAKTDYTSRMERLGAHAAATAAATPPPSAAAEQKRRGWFQKRGVSLVAPPARTPAKRASAAAGAGGGVVVRTVTATGGDGAVPRPQRLVAAAMAVTLSMSAGLPKGSKRAAALSWLMSGR